jgi:hypothetical protein
LGGLTKISRIALLQLRPLSLSARSIIFHAETVSAERTASNLPMQKIISAGLLLLTCGILSSVFVALASWRFEICDDTLPPLPARGEARADSPAPTPAPPRGLVTLRIQADKPGFEVSWADN